MTMHEEDVVFWAKQAVNPEKFKKALTECGRLRKRGETPVITWAKGSMVLNVSPKRTRRRDRRRSA